jgi:hypothetical protein
MEFKAILTPFSQLAIWVIKDFIYLEKISKFENFLKAFFDIS